MTKENNNNFSSEKIVENLSDFALFLSVMKNREAYECILSIILDEPNLELKQVKVEEVILNQPGKRAIRLDAWAESIDERQFNMEMQNDTKKDEVPKRSRFYQGLMDVPILKSGKNTKYKQLPSTIIIFITQEDIFGWDCAMYEFTEQCESIQGLHLGDGTKKIFLNMMSKNGRAELVSLLQYMKDSRLDNPELVVLDDRLIRLNKIVTEVKKSEEWEEIRMTIMEYAMEKGTEIGKEIGKEIGIRAFVLDSIEENRPMELVLDKLERLFTLDEIQARMYYDKFSNYIQ